VQIVAVAPDFADRVRVPKIKLPATAVVFHLNDPEKMRRQFKVTFQSLIGLANIGAGQNELPQLELRTEDAQGGQIVSATYENLPDDAPVSNDIIYNFSPTLAFVDHLAVLSSTRELAVELMKLTKRDEPAPPASEQVINTSVNVDNQVLRNVLEMNRENLIAQNMLEKGHERPQAEKEIGTLLALLKLLRNTSLELATVDKNLRLELKLRFALDD
jgi:hypothetical protein